MFSRLSMEVFFIRAPYRYILEIFLPSIKITFLSFIRLIQGTGSAFRRLHLSIFLVSAFTNFKQTTLLLMNDNWIISISNFKAGLQILLMTQWGDSIPRVSYLTALDVFLVICLITSTAVAVGKLGLLYTLNFLSHQTLICKLIKL